MNVRIQAPALALLLAIAPAAALAVQPAVTSSVAAAVPAAVIAAQSTASPGNLPFATTSSPEIAELQKVEDRWSTAVSQRDQYGLELVLSPLYVGVSSTGDIASRDQQIAQSINPTDKTEIPALDQKIVTVRMLGDVAVVNGTYLWRHRVNGNYVEEKGVFTHVFQQVRGAWLCVNAQRTALNTAPPATRVKDKEKAKSGNELPFHIPLFSKGDKSSTHN